MAYKIGSTVDPKEIPYPRIHNTAQYCSTVIQIASDDPEQDLGQDQHALYSTVPVLIFFSELGPNALVFVLLVSVRRNLNVKSLTKTYELSSMMNLIAILVPVPLPRPVRC